ncbi:MAG: hypothetical protein H0V35_09440, partial [Nitrospira sp.]|nr:hypothetical protein [Nitrospira sp.]
PGDELVPLPEGTRYLGFLLARGETPEDVERSLREAQCRLTVVITVSPPASTDSFPLSPGSPAMSFE